DPSLELFVQTLDRICGPGAAPLARRQPREGEEAIAGFFEAIGHRPTLEPPLADEGLAAALDLCRCRGVNHVRVVGGDLLVQTLGRVGEQVPVLVHGAALPDCGDGPLQSLPAIHDQELRAAQAATGEIIENTAPGVAALPTHAL